MEEALGRGDGGGGQCGAGVCLGRGCKLLEYKYIKWQITHINKSWGAMVVYKDPSLCLSLFWRSRTQKKDGCREKHKCLRLLSVQNGCLLQMSSAGCLNSSYLKVSFNFLHFGVRGGIKCHSRHKQKVESKPFYDPEQSPPPGQIPATCSLENMACTLDFSGWTVLISAPRGKSHSRSI